MGGFASRVDEARTVFFKNSEVVLTHQIQANRGVKSSVATEGARSATLS
jgi:hypothetical protein